MWQNMAKLNEHVMRQTSGIENLYPQKEREAKSVSSGGKIIVYLC
jgi:hypothetical protein